MMLTYGCSIARDEAAGHLVARLVEMRVHRRDEEVEAGEERRRPSPGSHRRAMLSSDPCSKRHAVRPASAAQLARAGASACSVGHALHGQQRRMIGHRVVAVPRRLAAADHLLSDASPSVRFVCVCRSPRTSASSTRSGQRPGECRFDLATVLAQGRRDPRQVQARVDLLLGLATRSAVSSSTSNRPYSESLSPCSTRDHAQPDVVRLRAGEVLQRRTPRRRAGSRAGRPGRPWSSARTTSWCRAQARRPRAATRRTRHHRRGSSDATSRSMSPIVSRILRNEPAYVARCTCGSGGARRGSPRRARATAS